jgi:glycopeptide antibiotics resistance protein
VVAEPATASQARRNRLLIVAAAIYASALAVVLLWPVHIDGEGGFIRFEPILDVLSALGIPAWASYPWVEFAANVALFVPLGILWLAAARVPRFRRIASATVLAAAISIGAEALQHLVVPDRTTDARDVVANVSGAALGALAMVSIARRLGTFGRAPAG